MEYEVEKYKELLKKLLSEYRYIHSLGVAKMAKDLANAHGLDENKAYIAGLLHDITKEMSEKYHDDIFKKYNDLDKLEEKRQIKHSHSSKYYLMEELNIFDQDILDAVYNHTICNSQSPYAKILFIADKREENRGINDGIVDLAMKDLQKGYEALLKDVDNYIKSKGL